MGFFYPFTPVTVQKIKFQKKWKRHLEISSFYRSIPKIMIIWYNVPEIWQLLFFILAYFLPFYPLTWPKNENFKKMKKDTRRYHHFTKVYQKLWSYAILFLRYAAWRTDVIVSFHFGLFFTLLPTNSLFHMKIITSVTKSLHEDCGPCYLHLQIFFLIHTLSSSAGK